MDRQVSYQGQIKRLRNRALRLNVTQRGEAVLGNFTTVQRNVMTEVFNVIYQSADDLQEAQGLVDRIIARLNQKRAHVKRGARKPRGR